MSKLEVSEADELIERRNQNQIEAIKKGRAGDRGFFDDRRRRQDNGVSFRRKGQLYDARSAFGHTAAGADQL